jgi:hypothetical protein
MAPLVVSISPMRLSLKFSPPAWGWSVRGEFDTLTPPSESYDREEVVVLIGQGGTK